jgi:hypothetical protein
MRLYRHEPSSRLPHSAPSAPFKSSRMPRLILAVALAFLVLPSPARAQPRDLREAALDDFVAARMLTTKCPSWQLDSGVAQRRFSELDLEPADWQTSGRYASFFNSRLSFYSSLLSRMPEKGACEAAEAAFGPGGRVRSGWMKRQ